MSFSEEELKDIDRKLDAYANLGDPQEMYETADAVLQIGQDTLDHQTQRLSALKARYEMAIAGIEARIEAEHQAMDIFAEMQAKQAEADQTVLETELARRPQAILDAASARHDELVDQLNEARSVPELKFTDKMSQDVLLLEIYESLGVSLNKASRHSSSEVWKAIGVLSSD